MISLIAAVSRNGVIGRDNDLPWRLPADLRYFKAVTLGKPVIMGRKNYASIGRVLPGRKNIIVTRDPSFVVAGAIIAHSVEAALAQASPAEEVMVIGGAEIYRATLPLAQKLYITWVHAEIAGDVFFPAIDWAAWRENSREDHLADADHPYSFSFTVYERENV
jgi:dihydrofolate reductase